MQADLELDDSKDTLLNKESRKKTAPDIPLKTPLCIELYKVLKVSSDPYVSHAWRPPSTVQYLVKRSLLDIGVVALWIGICAAACFVHGGPLPAFTLLQYVVVIAGTLCVLFVFVHRMLELRTVVLDVLDDVQEAGTIKKLRAEGLDLKMQLWNRLKIPGKDEDLTYDEVNAIPQMRAAVSRSYSRILAIVDSEKFPDKLFDFVPWCFERESNFSKSLIYFPCLLLIVLNAIPLLALPTWTMTHVILGAVLILVEFAFCWALMLPKVAQGICNFGLKCTAYHLNKFIYKELQPIWEEEVLAHGTMKIRDSLQLVMEHPNRGAIANRMSTKMKASCTIQ